MAVRRGVLFYAYRSQFTVIHDLFTKMAGVLLFRHSAKSLNAQEERQGSSEVARA